jgi:hypothetical protein
VEHEFKAVQATGVKFDEAKGTVEAVIATLGVIDKDGDVTLPGFFGEQEVAVAWAHDRSQLIGKGRIYEDGDEAKFDGAFFMDTIEGREKFLTTKAMGGLQEWSYGFRLKEGGYSFGEQDSRQVRFLQPHPSEGTPGVDVDEVSPVLVGAGEGTRTLAMKSDGLRFVDQAEQVAVAAELLAARADQIKTLRAADGKELGAEAVARLLEVKTRLEQVAEMFGTMADTPPPADDHTADFLQVRSHLAAAQEMAGRR